MIHCMIQWICNQKDGTKVHKAGLSSQRWKQVSMDRRWISKWWPMNTMEWEEILTPTTARMASRTSCRVKQADHEERTTPSIDTAMMKAEHSIEGGGVHRTPDHTQPALMCLEPCRPPGVLQEPPPPGPTCPQPSVTLRPAPVSDPKPRLDLCPHPMVTALPTCWTGDSFCPPNTQEAPRLQQTHPSTTPGLAPSPDEPLPPEPSLASSPTLSPHLPQQFQEPVSLEEGRPILLEQHSCGRVHCHRHPTDRDLGSKDCLFLTAWGLKWAKLDKTAPLVLLVDHKT